MYKIEAVNTKKIKEKLNNLESLMPGEPQFIYDFGKYISSVISDKVNQVSYNVTIEMAIGGLKEGINYFKNKPVPKSISRKNSSIYDIISLSTPRIAKVVCPSDFAKKVSKVYDEMYA